MTNLLTLDDLTERHTVQISGKAYEMTNPAELSVIDYHRLGRRGLRLDAIMAKDDASVEELDEAKRILDLLCRAILHAPDDVHERLTDSNRLRIINVFTVLQRDITPLVGSLAPGAANRATAAGEPEPKTSTTASS